MGSPDRLPTSVSDVGNRAAFSPFQLALLTLMVLQNSAVVLLGRYSQAGVEEADRFSTKSLVALTEALKLAVCLVLIGVDNLRERFPHPNGSQFLPALPLASLASMMPKAIVSEISLVLSTPKNSAAVSVPAALYLFQNNILYVALANLSAPVFQVCYQSKLVTTALVSVAMLGRSYKSLQWAALFSLGCGVAVVAIGEKGDGGDKDDKDVNLPIGLFAVALASLSSAFAGVWFEKVIKGIGSSASSETKKPTSLWVRNVELAFFSIVFAYFYGVCESLFFSGYGGGSSGGIQGGQQLSDQQDSQALVKPFLHGFTPVTYILVILQAGGGLLVAAIVKYADNVVKGLATGVAVVLSTTISCLFLGTEVKFHFIFGGFVILSSVWIFSNPDKVTEILNSQR